MKIDRTQKPPPEYLIALLKKMNQRDEYVNSLSKSLAILLEKDNRTFEESMNMFRDACTIYEQAIEGIFSSAVKILYFLIAENSQGVIPEPNEAFSVWDIWNNFEKAHIDQPVFLENWPEKNHIRNAIAHSQNQYDPVLDKVHFLTRDIKTGKITYESPNNMTFSDFFALWIQIADAIDSMRYSHRVYGIFQSLVIASA
jgi:hypothetical protein